MNQQLAGKIVAMLVDMGFEQVELTGPRQALEEAGAKAHIVSPQHEQVRGWQHTDWGDTFPVDVALADVDPAEYDALVLPGGVMNPDNLRTNPQVVEFVRSMFNAGKPIATICHGPWTLIEAGVIRGYTITSYPSIKTDLKNAGAQWVDQEVVVDRGVVSSRRPDDLPAFNETMVAEFARERQVGRTTSTAPHESFGDGTGQGALGYDSPPAESSHITNEEYRKSPEPNIP
jgi:protease I